MERVNWIGDQVLKVCLMFGFGCVVLLGSAPIMDAWLHYGVVTGVVATLLIGGPIIGVGFIVYDVLNEL